MSLRTTVRLELWGGGDLQLLERLMGDPAMTEHLGGPESPEKLAERQERYERLADTETDRMFKIVDGVSGQPCGSVGFWAREWQGERVYEIGWSVLPEFQGRGIATTATSQAIKLASEQRGFRSVHAYPSVDNPPSNAICKKLGFSLLGEYDFEFPPGNPMRCNDWRLDLEAGD